MSITGQINELDSITNEIKRLSIKLKELRKKKKELEDEISSFCEQQNKAGIKYKGNQFIPETKQKIDRKRNSKTKEKDASEVLQKYGITPANATTLVKEMLEAMRGPRTEETSLKIKKLK